MYLGKGLAPKQALFRKLLWIGKTFQFSNYLQYFYELDTLLIVKVIENHLHEYALKKIATSIDNSISE